MTQQLVSPATASASTPNANVQIAVLWAYSKLQRFIEVNDLENMKMFKSK